MGDNKIRTILSPEDAMKLVDSIGMNNRNTGVKSSFIITRLEGKDEYIKGRLDVPRVTEMLQELIRIYPNFQNQLQQIMDDCSERYTFRSNIETFDEFKSELTKYNICNEDVVKLMFDEGTTFDSDVYMQLYKEYVTNGASRIQSMIDSLQGVDPYSLMMAFEGWRIEDQVIDMKPIPFDELNIPSWEELFKE